MKPWWLLALLSLSGCASLTADEKAQLAYRGEGANPCLFGGVSPAAEQHCQEISGGLPGRLRALNAGLNRRPRSCQQHVAAVRSALWERDDLEVQSVFSCPPQFKDCHVSALVITDAGQAYVLDNGSLLKPQQFTGSVSSFGEFSSAAGGRFWFHPPVIAQETPGISEVPGEPRRRR